MWRAVSFLSDPRRLRASGNGESLTSGATFDRRWVYVRARSPNPYEVDVVKDAAENSQALRDSRRAGSDLTAAEAAGADEAVLAELTKVRTCADERVESLRRRAS